MVEAYVYHRPKASRTKRICNGDWARRKEKGSELIRLEEEEAIAARLAETRAGVCPLLASVLEDKTGAEVDPETALAVGGLSASTFYVLFGGPANRRFTPMLKKFYDEVNGDGKPKQLEIVFISSDDSAEQQQEYMDAMHGDWLRVAFPSDVRAKLKARYGVFAPSEAGEFPNVTQRSAPPTLVLFGPNFEELGVYVGDDGGNGINLVSAKGPSALNACKPLAWPATLPATQSASVAPTALPTGIEAEVLTLHKLEAEWSGLEADAEAYRQALLEKLSNKRGPELEFARLRRGCARLTAWLAANDKTLTSTALPGLREDADDKDNGKDDEKSHCEPDCDVLTMLYDAQRVDADLAMKQREVAQLALLAERLKDEPEYASRAAELFAAVGPSVTNAVPHMKDRVKELEEHKAWLAKRRAERLEYDNKVAEFESTVDRAIELTAFPVPTIDTAEHLSNLLKEGNAQADASRRPRPRAHRNKPRQRRPIYSSRGATSCQLSKCVQPSARVTLAASVEQARLLAECAALARAYRIWDSRTNRLLTLDPSRKAAEADDMRTQAELAAAQLPEGEAHLEKSRRLRAQLRSYDDTSISLSASLPPEDEMKATIEHVREMSQRLSVAASAAPPRFDRKSVSQAVDKLGKERGSVSGLERFDAAGREHFNPFPLDSAPPSRIEINDSVDQDEFSRTVIEWVNRVRAQPQAAAAEFRLRHAKSYDGNVFSPPWLKGGKPIDTKEGRKALEDLIDRLERMPPLPPLEHLPELQIAAHLLGQELAAGKERSKTSAIEDRLRARLARGAVLRAKL